MEAVFIALLVIGLIIGLATGHQLAYVLGGVATVVGFLGWGPEVFSVFVSRFYGTMNDFNLVAIPMFLLMANFLTYSNIADGLFESLRYLLGSIRGGLAIAVIAVATVFAATTGIVGASVVTMGLLSFPILLKYGYQKELTVGVVAAGGTLGILIPPSIMLVIMGSQAQLSVGKLFMAAFTPGLILSLTYCLYVFIHCYRNPQYGPPLSPEEIAAWPFSKRIKNCLVNFVPPLILILSVLGTIYGGIATPTEAAGMGAFIALLLTIFYRKFSWQMLKDSLYSCLKTTSMVFVVLLGAIAFTAVFLGLGGDTLVGDFIKSLGLGRWGVWIVSMAVTFILGCFIDWIAIVMIVFPIFLPLMKEFGFDPLWFVMTVAIMLQTSFLTPPFGYALFFIQGIAPAEIKLEHIYRGVIPFIIAVILVIILCAVFPDIILWLPKRAS